MKQNIQIGESGYKFVCEFDGMFYSGIVKDINELGIQICVISTMEKCKNSLAKLKEWEH